jgi:DNA-binding LacI/PurR family transcriptional regulator
MTRSKVLAAIQQLGYRPNSAARTLATGHSMTLGVITLKGTFFGPISTLYGVEQAARAAGYFVSVVSLLSIDHRSVGDAVDRLTAQMVEGIAVIAPLTSAAEALDVLPANLPVVVVEGDPGGNLAAVRVDQEAGARTATAYLLSAGHDCVFMYQALRNGTSLMRGWRGGARPCKRQAPRSYRWCRGTGQLAQDTRRAGCWPGSRRRRPFSPPTTRWLWVYCGLCMSRVAAYPKT